MADQQLPITGGCLCGAIRFEATVVPLEGYYCHCKMCQKAYGGLFSATLRFHRSAFRFTKGTPKHYRSSEFAWRSFCENCGSPMPFEYDLAQDVWIKVGTLDNPEHWPMRNDATWGATKHWLVDFKIAWEEINDGLPQMTNSMAPNSQDNG